MIWRSLHKIIKSLFAGNMIIAWMMIASLVPMLLVVYMTYNMAKTTLYQTINRDITISMKKKVVRFDNYISERKLDLVQLSKLPDILNFFNQNDSGKVDPKLVENLRAYLTYLEKKIGIVNLYMIDLNGKILFALNDRVYKEGDVLTDPQWKNSNLYQAFLGAKIIQIPYVITSFKKTHTDIYLSGIITEQGKMKGVLITSLNLQGLQQMVDQMVGYAKSESTFISTMMNGKPKIVMRSTEMSDKPLPLDKEALALLDFGLRGGTGRPKWDDDVKNPFVVASDYIPQLNMGLLIRYDESDIHERVTWYKLRILILSSISALIVLIVVYLVSHSLRRVIRKNEDLLGSILPSFVIEELNEKKRFAARNVDDVSIVFMDIVNFTSFSASRPPELVVKALDNLFMMIDKLCDKYQLEKIKTMGDAHMSAAGLIQHQEDHANRAVDMALEAIVAIKHYNLDYGSEFSLRVGIDSGTITAGIVGTKKPGYDIWGHTVNRASRMESTGYVNQVQITEATYQALQHKENYEIVPRTGVAIKGLGEMDTYLISHMNKNVEEEDF